MKNASQYSAENEMDVRAVGSLSAVQPGKRPGLQTVRYGCDFIRHCEQHMAEIGETEWYAMLTNLSGFEGGAALIHRLSRSYPGYDKAATQRKIDCHLDSGVQPVTCRAIVRRGFRCPRRALGVCCCKAPADLAGQPMSSEGLQAALSAQPVSDNEAENIRAASEFVQTFLSTQDRASAYGYLYGPLKAHYRLQSGALRVLEAVQRNAAKALQAEQDAQARADPALPQWYVSAQNGLRFLPGVLAQYMASSQQVFFAADRYYRYQGGVYVPMTDLEAQRMCQQQMLPRETRMGQITDAERQWRLMAQKDAGLINPDPYCINLRNGLYDVRQGTLRPHTPSYCSTMQLPVRYDPGADCPRFRTFLTESMEGDMEQVALIQEMLGYFLVPVTAAQKAFVIVGAGGAGKSVLLRVLNEVLLGKDNVSNVSWQSLNERFKVAELFGKLANIFADLPTYNLDDNGIFKALVGEDTLTVERKNQHPFSFKSTARLLFSCNSIPRNYGDRSEGFYRRLIIIRFAHSVPEAQRDPHLLERLREEGDGILQFALAGLRRLMDNRFRFAEAEKNLVELQKYRVSSDSVLAFVSECCVLDAQAEENTRDLYEHYTIFCNNSGFKANAIQMFVQELHNHCPDVVSAKNRYGSKRIQKGIRLL